LEPRHRRRRPGSRARDRHARARRVLEPRAAPADPPSRRPGRAGGDGHRRGLAALRPRRDDGDDRQPRGARGHQRARRQASGWGAGPVHGARHRGMTIDAEPAAAGRALARLYDLDLVEDPGDIDLYLALASRTGGPVLELAAGTGRVAVPLAEAGHRVTAVDIDQAMLARARDLAGVAATAARERIEFVEADLLGLDLAAAGTFKLAFI